MRWCEKYIDIPFVDNGRAPSGCDCWGLVCLVYAQERGIRLPDFAGEYHGADDIAAITRLHDYERQHWEAVARPEAFDLISLRVKGLPWHVGIAVGAGKMIHCLRTIGTVIEAYTRPVWASRIDGYYRWAS